MKKSSARGKSTRKPLHATDSTPLRIATAFPDSHTHLMFDPSPEGAAARRRILIQDTYRHLLDEHRSGAPLSIDEIPAKAVALVDALLAAQDKA